VVPQDYLNFAAHYPIVINGRVQDIRKRVVSNNLVTDVHQHDGPVIVKTDLNCGGLPEEWHRAARLPLWCRICRKVSKYAWDYLPGAWKSIRITGLVKYKVYEHPALVPRAVFRAPSFFVERFLQERRGIFFCHRRYYFLGNQEVNQLWLGRSPICANDE